MIFNNWFDINKILIISDFYLFYLILSYVMLCYVMLCYVMLKYYDWFNVKIVNQNIIKTINKNNFNNQL